MNGNLANAVGAVLLLSACTAQAGGEKPVAAAPASAVEAALRSAAAQWADAIRDNDHAALDRLMRPEFHLSGDGRDRPVPLAEWRANLDRMEIAHYQSQTASIQYYGDVAILRTTGAWKVTLGGNTRDTAFELADFWILDNGQWRIFRRHALETS